jgi:hypothetical protein
MPHARSLLPMVTAFVLAGASAACRDAGPSLAERAAAVKAAEEAADARSRAASRARLEAQRIAALWRYQHATAGGGAQVTAAIDATDDLDVDGRAPTRVQLVFRDHVQWGRSAYLVLQAGDFACRPNCTVQVTADETPARSLSAWRPDTDEAIALFIRDTAAFWRLTGDATRLRIAFPVRAGGTREASFEVVGLDESRMPGW